MKSSHGHRSTELIPSARYEIRVSSVQNSSCGEPVDDFNQFLVKAKVRGVVVGGAKSRPFWQQHLSVRSLYSRRDLVSRTLLFHL